jgi:hypothetical protein
MNKKRRRQQVPVRCHLLSLHRNKTKKDNDECQLIIVVFFGCTKTKQKKMMMNVGFSSSSLGA